MFWNPCAICQWNLWSQKNWCLYFPKKNKNVFFHCFLPNFLKIFSIFSVKNMIFVCWDMSKFKIYECRSAGLKSNLCAVHAKKVYTLFVKIFSRGREILPGGDFSPPSQCQRRGDFSPQGDFPPTWRTKGGEISPPPSILKTSIMNIEFAIKTAINYIFT